MTDSSAIVFVVDDDPSVRGAIFRLLRSVGLRCEAFAPAEEFLSPPLPDAPSCLTLALCIPGLDGLDTQRALAERNSGLPIVFITGHGDIPRCVHAMKAGAEDFLSKPF